MKKGTVVLAVTLGTAGWIMGCGSESMEAREGRAQLFSEGDSGVAFSSSSFVEREFWLALAEEPGWHLLAAHEELLKGHNRQAGGEFEKVAAILNFETRHCHSLKERGMLLASIPELREVARGLLHEEHLQRGSLGIGELERVSASAFRAIAAHQLALGREALVDGDALMAGRYILETTKAVESGFEQGGIPLGDALSMALRRAREVAARLENEGDGSKEEGKATLDDLDAAITGLGNELTSRKK